MVVIPAFFLILGSAPAVAPPVAPEDKVICRYQDGPDLGSHIARRTRVCMRSSEWKAQEAIADNAKRRMEETRQQMKPVGIGFGPG